ncbi:MAG TPA: hydroxymethylglutaryl-CoA lyase [Bacillales bacterium]|nr:hydroxymethylglutaryl-CoA lyase [Bacillales bacterium]
MKRSITVTEVVTRDGFQIEPEWIDTERKIALVHDLIAAGVRRFELSSFVHPVLVPNMKDAEELFAAFQRVDDVVFCGLVLNEKGAERALAAKVDEINYVFSASETHNRKNSRQSVQQSLTFALRLAEMSKQANIPLNVGLATSFGCPFEGVYSAQKLWPLLEPLAAAGIRSICLADTTGMAHPLQIKETCRQILQRWPHLLLQLHLHNTRGMGLANALAGIEAGVTHFDSSLAGLGGCPFAPGASGNICSEDFVHMLHLCGYETGIDLDRLIACARGLEKQMGRTLPGQVMKAGKTDDLHPADSVPG